MINSAILNDINSLANPSTKDRVYNKNVASFINVAESILSSII